MQKKVVLRHSRRIFTFLILFLSAGLLIAENSKDSLKSNNDSLVLEWNKQVKQTFTASMETDTGAHCDILPPDSVIANSLVDSILNLRMDSLNATSPVSLKYNPVIRKYMELYLLRKKELTARVVTRKNYYFDIYEKMLDKYNLPLELKYVSIIESALNPKARSWAGASGLWQFMMPTARMYNLDVGAYVDERYDLYKSTEAACQHFRDLYKTYGDWLLVLAAYNSGSGNVNRAIRRAGGAKDFWKIKSFLPRETQGYVPSFIAVNYVFNYAEKHGIKPVKTTIPFVNTDTVAVKQKLQIAQVSEYLGVEQEFLEKMNPAFRRGVIPKAGKRTYNLYLPSQYVNEFLAFEDSIYLYKTTAQKEREEQLREKYGDVVEGKHRVRHGQSLGMIASRYGCDISDVKKWNNLRSNMIHPGDKLTVYAPEKVLKGEVQPKNQRAYYADNSGDDYIYHKVRKGDTLSEIAEQYPGTSVRTIKRLNNIRNERRLRLGQKLKIAREAG